MTDILTADQIQDIEFGDQAYGPARTEIDLLIASHKALRAALEAAEAEAESWADDAATLGEKLQEAQARVAALTDAAREFEALSAPADGHPEGQATWRVAQHRLLEVAGLLRAAPPEGEA